MVGTEVRFNGGPNVILRISNGDEVAWREARACGERQLQDDLRRGRNITLRNRIDGFPRESYKRKALRQPSRKRMNNSIQMKQEENEHPKQMSWPDAVRDLIQHENNLINHRIGWMATLEGLLFAALSFSWQDPSRAGVRRS